MPAASPKAVTSLVVVWRPPCVSRTWAHRCRSFLMMMVSSSTSGPLLPFPSTNRRKKQKHYDDKVVQASYKQRARARGSIGLGEKATRLHLRLDTRWRGVWPWCRPRWLRQPRVSSPLLRSSLAAPSLRRCRCPPGRVPFPLSSVSTASNWARLAESTHAASRPTIGVCDSRRARSSDLRRCCRPTLRKCSRSGKA